MIHTHSLGRAARYFAARPALASGGRRSTYRDLRDRVASIAAALHGHGLAAGDRLALLLSNESDYIELVYACAWLGVIAVPLNTRLTAVELDHVLIDASPRGLIRHSSLPVPTVQPPWQRVIDKDVIKSVR
jgi:acyl-CoA synthetase (AMP-forming)/AMP-acid ligase II